MVAMAQGGGAVFTCQGEGFPESTSAPNCYCEVPMPARGAAASRALGIRCVDDVDNDDASLAADATQKSTPALEKEIDLPEDGDYNF